MAEPEVDARTIEGCRHGDPEAQRRVFECYKDRVFSIALNFLKGDDAAAKDVTQEVFLQVFKKARRFEGRSKFSTWLYRIAVNRSLNRLRAVRRREARTDASR